MRKFTCSCPTHPELFFESISCETCGKLVGFSDKLNTILSFDLLPNSDIYVAGDDKTQYRCCENYAVHQVCNGMVELNSELPTEQQPTLCNACHYNQTIPDLSVPAHLGLWRKLEIAKRRTLFTLNQLRLPLPDRTQDPEGGLCFHFMADKTADDHFRSALPNHSPVFTGHDKGNITINLAEADEVARANAKESMGEEYRTLLGHFRHELGHYYWDQLIAPNPQRLIQFRELFGDDEEDYQAALDKHYNDGPPSNWQENYISAYASMHAWEDWAETWAHYLHMVDTLETAQSVGLHIKAGSQSAQAPSISALTLPQQLSYYDRQTSIDIILETWINFSVILNSLNRSMGLADAYPFVLYPNITEKLKFVHSVIHEQITTN